MRASVGRLLRAEECQAPGDEGRPCRGEPSGNSAHGFRMVLRAMLRKRSLIRDKQANDLNCHSARNSEAGWWWTPLPQFRNNDRSEMIHPASDRLVRNYNSALGEHILDVTKAEREPKIKPNRPVNDLRTEPIFGVADFRHALPLPSRQPVTPPSTSFRQLTQITPPERA